MGYTSGRPYVNVLDFGAKGDGTQDDAPHIHAEINKAYGIRESGAENAVTVLIPDHAPPSGVTWTAASLT